MPSGESPLASAHAELGAIMTDFGGWRLPVEYSSVAEETHATRHGAGLFDVSHMGNLRLLGEGAAAAARRLLTRDATAAPACCGGYALLCNDQGGIIDDLIFMVTSESAIGLVINASHHDTDVAWLSRHIAGVQVADQRTGSMTLTWHG